jgi:hypothetical protein
MKVEASIKLAIPEVTLTESIGKASPLRWGRIKIRSTVKINIFYGIGGLAIVLAIAALLFTANLSMTEPPAAESAKTQGGSSSGAGNEP